MAKYVAFLRAINVGGHVVKMDRLRALFEELKFANVQTFIASGNVIFESPSRDPAVLECMIEQHLRAALGYDVLTFVRSPEELAAIAARTPFEPAEPIPSERSLYIEFLRNPPSRSAADALLRFRSPAEDFQVVGREIHWLIRGKFSDSKFTSAMLEKTLRLSATIRNATTVGKLADKCRGLASLPPSTPYNSARD